MFLREYDFLCLYIKIIIIFSVVASEFVPFFSTGVCLCIAENATNAKKK